tara:strand:+ start:1033 stop:2160 length:1128 start_codon:yes stop_codon:yes gene_type:complete
MTHRFQNALNKTSTSLKTKQNKVFTFDILSRAESRELIAPLMFFFEVTKNDSFKYDKVFVLYKSLNVTLNSAPNFRVIKQTVAKHMNALFKKKANKSNTSLHIAIPLFKHQDRHAIEIICDTTHLHINLHTMFMPHLNIKPICSKKWKYSHINSITDWFPISGEVNNFIDELGKVFISKVPVSFLMFNEYQNLSRLHIEYGYTYKDSEKYGYSTLMRKLLQFYALENGMMYLTTDAIKWGSQIASKKAGFLQLPTQPRELKNKQVKELLFYDNKSKTTKSKRAQLKLKTAFRTQLKPKASQSTTQGKLTHRNEQTIKRLFRTQKLPLNIYGNGNKKQRPIIKDILTSLGIHRTRNDVSHIRKVNHNKLTNIYSKL